MKYPTPILRTVLSAAAFLALPASAQEGFAWAYRSNNNLVWSETAHWVDVNNTGSPMNRLPTENDNVYVWAGTLESSANTLVVASGETALTKDFSLGYVKADNTTGASKRVFFAIADGGCMTNAGVVTLGKIDGATSGRSVGGRATVRSGGSWTAKSDVVVGGGFVDWSRLAIEQGGTMTQTSGNFLVADAANGSTRYSGAVTNDGTLAVNDLYVGNRGIGSVGNSGTMSVNNLRIGQSGSGTLENTGDLAIAARFNLALTAGSSGSFIHGGGTISHTGAASYPIRIGYLGTGRFEVAAPLAFASEMMVVGGENGSVGTLAVGDALSGVRILKLGENAGASGTLLLDGGSVTFNATTAATTSDSGHCLWVGSLDASGNQAGTGEIRGYGKLGRTEADSDAKHARLRNNGRIVADGGDLDLGLFRLVGLPGVDANPDGLNGWFAVNGGRLIYPRRLPSTSLNHVAVGDYGTFSASNGNPDISLVNSLQERLFQDGAQRSSDNRTFAMLYATDRTDIPGTIPCDSLSGDRVLGVWRLGHFTDIDDVGDTPQAPWAAFDTVSVRIRFDDAGIDWTSESVMLFRYDGTEWRRVGKATEGVHVGTSEPQPRYDSETDNWNIGWYAVVCKKTQPFVLVVR